MSSERIKPEAVDRPEPDEALSGTTPRSRDHEPSDDDREVILDDPGLPEVAIEDDAPPPARPGGPRAD